VADAIEAAHEKGIVHRDLKPSNIKLPPGGGVKVLDFGIATMSRRSAAAAATHTDQRAAPVLWGTGAYMSPEQIRGDAVDERTDVWAFGCVLYELLTGRRPFAAETTAETVAAILEREPDWGRLPDALPASVRGLLRRCLQKESRQRLRAIGDARIELQEALGPVQPPDAEPRRQRLRGRSVAAWSAAMLALGAIAATGLTSWRRAEPPPVAVARFAVSAPAGERLAPAPAIALSPDGERLAFVAVREGIPRLFVRSLGEIDPAPVPGSEGADQPFFSHDGQWIGFFAERQLKKAPVVGGASVVVGGVAVPRGATWLPDDTIVVGTSNDGLFRVPAAGGTPVPLTRLGEGEGSHRWPHALPGGQAILYAAGSAINFRDAVIVVQSLASGERRTLGPRGTYPRYLDTGHVLYVTGRALRAIPFDGETLEVTGELLSLAERIEPGELNAGAADLDVSRTGVLAYVPGSPDDSRTLVWVDRHGGETPVSLPRPIAEPFDPRVAPDGTRLAFTTYQPDPDIWVFDLIRHTLVRLTQGGWGQWPVWTPDGRHITFASSRGGPAQLFRIPADGSGPAVQLTSTRHAHAPRFWSLDGGTLLFDDVSPSGLGPWLLHVADGKPGKVERVTWAGFQGALSPDGRMMAYRSNESGRNEVYVTAFPGPGPRLQISVEGGTEPVWAPAGRELFFRHDDDVFSVDMGDGATPGRHRLLFTGSFAAGQWIRNYDVAPDGQRFVMVRSSDHPVSPPPIIIALNWRAAPAGSPPSP
jgi:serine/threonine-protein kinase